MRLPVRDDVPGTPHTDRVRPNPAVSFRLCLSEVQEMEDGWIVVGFSGVEGGVCSTYFVPSSIAPVEPFVSKESRYVFCWSS